MSKGKKPIFITLLVIFDVYLKPILVISIEKKTKSSHVCEELQKVFINFGLPKYLVSDNGNSFNSSAFI